MTKHHTKTKAVANFFYNLASSPEREIGEISALKVIKLAYFANGWSLALLDKPLLDCDIVVWRFGPSIPCLMSYYEGHGLKNIPSSRVAFSSEEMEILWSVWRHYGPLSDIELSNLSNQEGTPWYNLSHESNVEYLIGMPIAESDLKAFFSELRENTRKAHEEELSGYV